MKKRILSLLFAVALVVMATIPVSAQTPEASGMNDPPAVSSADSNEGFTISVSDGVIGQNNSGPTEVQRGEDDNTTANLIGFYPYEIRYENHNGAPIIIKSFKVPAGHDPDSLIEEDFEEDGFIYSKKDVLISEAEKITDGKTVAEAISFATEDNEQASILAAISPIIDYSEGGYTGQLALDYASIMSTIASEESYSYPIRRTVEVSNLDDNDYAYLNKNLNGLTLTGVDTWDLSNGVQRAETMIPGQLTAHAVYTGTGYGTKVTGYTNTAYYTGYVTRTYEGDAVYSIVYKGVEDPSSVVKNEIPWTGIFATLAILVLIGGAAALLFLKVIPAIRNRNNGGGTPPVEVPQ